MKRVMEDLFHIVLIVVVLYMVISQVWILPKALEAEEAFRSERIEEFLKNSESEVVKSAREAYYLYR